MENDREKLNYEVLRYSISDKKSNPGIIVYNKLENYIQLIEVGITYLKTLIQREYRKKRKYFRLAMDIYNEIGIRAQAVALMLMWEGFVMKHFKLHIHY